MSVTVELVRFRVVPGREEYFVAKRGAALEGLRTLPGLLSATLAKADDGSWLDVIVWRSRDEALAADRALQAGQVPAAVLDWASEIEGVDSMSHGEVVHHEAQAPTSGPAGR